jgi:DNA-binding transcriptional ArsR family regulator
VAAGKEANVDRSVVLKVFESLGSSLRLDLFCVLVQAGEAGRVAGEIAETLEIPATNLSFHLKAMLQANLVTVRQEGRFLRYRANVPHMLRVLAYVMENCARADDGACVRVRGGAKAQAPQPLAPQAPATP